MNPKSIHALWVGLFGGLLIASVATCGVVGMIFLISAGAVMVAPWLGASGVAVVEELS